MDQPLKYEQLIAQKLANLPIPDLEDMIWARVKAQLDIDMPADDSDDDDDIPDAPAGPRIGWGLPVLILAFVTAFFFFKNKTGTTTNSKQQPQITTPLPSPPGKSTDPPLLRNDANQPDNTNRPAGIMPPAIDTPFADTIMQQDTNDVAVSPGTIDSSAVIPNPSIKTGSPPASSDTIPAQKKQRGVRDIKDDDYRIVPKNNKDS
jgi:hypothetical protein